MSPNDFTLKLESGPVDPFSFRNGGGVAYFLYRLEHTYVYSISLGQSINNVVVILLHKVYVVMWTSSLNKLYLVNWATKGEGGVKKVQKTDMVHV